MIETDLGIRGAKRTSFREANLRELALKVIDENPGADRDQVRDLLALAIKQNENADSYIEVCIEYACSTTINNMMPRAPANPARQAERAQAAALAEQIVATKLATVVERRAQQIILDIIMPNGKTMREVTGTYLAKVNSGYAKIAKAAGAKKIGDVLSESQVRKLMR